MTLEGMDALRAAVTEAPVALRKHVSGAIRETTYAIADRAKALVPRDSGDLYRAIEAQPPAATGSSLIGRVGLSDRSVYYWRFVEFGTRYMAARPFFRPAAESERERFIGRLQAIGPRLASDTAEAGRRGRAPRNTARGSGGGGGLL